MAVTIKATSKKDGSQSTITLEKTGDDTGTIDVDGSDYQVFDIRVSNGGRTLTCKTRKLFLTITVTVEVIAAQPPNSAEVRLTIQGSVVQDGTTEYTIGPADETNLTQFISTSDFPAA